jgi:anti-sigma factor RsiW
MAPIVRGRIPPAGRSIEGNVTPECERTRRRLSDHLDGELPPRARRRVVRHLARCPDCAPVFASLVRVVGGLRSLGRVTPPAPVSVVPEVVARLTGEPPPARRALAICLERASLRRTLAIALVVGTILTSVNQGDVLLAGAATWLTGVKIAMNFVVPFVVSNLGLLAARSSARIER